MLLYLPERIYFNVFMKDKTYAKKVNKATEKIFTHDFVKSMIDYENDNKDIKELQDYVMKKAPEEYKMELELCFNDDLKQYENRFKEMDPESKLYWLCEVDGGNQVDTKEFNDRNTKFKFLYEQFVLHNPEKYSNFFHMMYYAKLMYDEILELSKKEKTFENIQKFIKVEEKIYNECVARASDERFYQMMFSKREQMYVMMFEFFGQFVDDMKNTVSAVKDHLYNGKFKYNDFTYFKTIFDLLAFQSFLDKSDVENARKSWVSLTSLINFAFENKDYAIKSLNHYNNSFLDEFLGVAKFVYYVDKIYMNKHYLTIDENLDGMELDFFDDKFDKEFLSKYINDDPSFSYDWAKSKKVMFSLI